MNGWEQAHYWSEAEKRYILCGCKARFYAEAGATFEIQFCPLHAAAETLLKVCCETFPSKVTFGEFAFPDDLHTIAGILDEGPYKAVAQTVRDKAEAIRTAIAEATGKEPS